MRVVQSGSVYQLTFMPRFFPVNCYIVKEDDGLTLIDAALSFSAKGIESTIQKLKLPIRRIVLTHAHGDHVGALDLIKEMHPEADVLISKRDSRLLEGDLSLNQEEPQTPIRGGVPKNLKTRANWLLKDGDQVGSLLAIGSPGHTPGSMSFLDTRTNLLIAGDAFQTRAGVAVAGTVNLLFPFPALGTWNKEEALKSAKKLKELKPDCLAVGHGEIVRKPVDKMQMAIEKLEKTLSKK